MTALSTLNAVDYEPTAYQATCVIKTGATPVPFVIGFTSSLAGAVVTILKDVSYYVLKSVPIP
jgi:hypothetical protein